MRYHLWRIIDANNCCPGFSNRVRKMPGPASQIENCLTWLRSKQGDETLAIFKDIGIVLVIEGCVPVQLVHECHRVSSTSSLRASSRLSCSSSLTNDLPGAFHCPRKR